MSKKNFFLMVIFIFLCCITQSFSLHFDFAKAKERCLIEEFFTSTVRKNYPIKINFFPNIKIL